MPKDNATLADEIERQFKDAKWPNGQPRLLYKTSLRDLLFNNAERIAAALRNHHTDELAQLKAERDALNARIVLIEDGQRKAAYDFSMHNQLIAVNEGRIEAGKRPLTISQFLAGVCND